MPARSRPAAAATSATAVGIAAARRPWLLSVRRRAIGTGRPGH
ncbi:hypothetical protein OG241_12305 [Streptomyces sp. NBC_01390]